MFIPKSKEDKKTEKAAQKKVLSELRDWCLSSIAHELHDGLTVDVSEVACGDPTCAPVDTVFTLIWKDGGRGVFAIPQAPKEVTQDDIIEHVPDDDVLADWKAGKDTHWPRRPALRYELGTRVECRIGPHPVKGWAPGRVVKQFYREGTWPPNMYAPYQIALHDGRLVFAPQDTDSVIRQRPPPAEDAPSSPEFVPNEDDDVDDSYMDEEDEDEGQVEELEDGDGQEH